MNIYCARLRQFKPNMIDMRLRETTIYIFCCIFNSNNSQNNSEIRIQDEFFGFHTPKTCVEVTNYKILTFEQILFLNRVEFYKL